MGKLVNSLGQQLEGAGRFMAGIGQGVDLCVLYLVYGFFVAGAIAY